MCVCTTVCVCITGSNLLIKMQILHHGIFVLSQSLFLRTPVGSQEPRLADQRHDSHPPVDASSRLGRQEGHHLQHLLPALRRQRRRRQHGPVRALRAGPALHPTAARPDRHLGGGAGLCDARQLHVPRRGRERSLLAGRGSATAGERHRQHASHWWVAALSSSAALAFFSDHLNGSVGQDLQLVPITGLVDPRQLLLSLLNVGWIS